MKYLYFFFFTIFTLSLQAQIINIPDANFKAKLLEANTTNNIASSTYLSITPIVIDSNGDNEIELSEVLQVRRLDVSNSSINSLEGIDSFINIQELIFNDNNVSEFNPQPLTSLINLECNGNNLSSLDLSYNLELFQFRASGNVINNIILPSLTQDIWIDLSFNQLSSIDLSRVNSIGGLWLNNNNLTTVVFNNPTHTYLCDAGINLSNNPLTFLDLSGLKDCLNIFDVVDTIDISNTLLSSLNFPSFDVYNVIISNNPNLQFVNLKNDSRDICVPVEPSDCVLLSFSMNNNPNLELICVDSNEFQDFVDRYPGIQITSYCNFTPGGSYNTVSGNFSLDCEGVNQPLSNQTINVNASFSSGTTFTNQNGNYVLYTASGNNTVTPTLPNNSFFTVSPANYTFNFTNYDNTETANFCLTPEGIHPDLEVSIIPSVPARPGFDATYIINYTNKGNQILSGDVTFQYDDAILDYLSSSSAIASQSLGNLTWNFTDLQPFENREIEVTLNVNAPTETPPVNNGDILNYFATISSSMNDETPDDNQMIYNQMVVGSFDPNDKSVSKTQIPINQIDDYLYYTIRFQNTGTFAAENIVLKDMIDYAKLDLTSLKVVSSSHVYRASVIGNKFEVFYENINLPPSIENELGSHGYFTFKIKPKSTVVINDVIENNAEIFFDYNFPIVTNTVTTTITMLNYNSFSKDVFKIYPNPTTSILNIQSEIEISNLVITNMLGQKLLSNSNQSTIDVSNLSKGTYFITIETDNGKQTQKFIKQ